MEIKQEQKAKEYACYDAQTKHFIVFMCRKCKFYDGRCTKNRVIRICAEKGLKNRD